MPTLAYAKVTGAKEISRLLRKLPRRVSQDILLRSLRVGANVIRKEAKARAPMMDAVPLNNKQYVFAKKKYGHLRDNIKVTQTKHKSGAAQMTVHTGDAFWGYFLEAGTYKMAARPWFTPAFEATASEALRRIGVRLGANIEKAAVMLAGPKFRMTKAFRRRLR